MDIEGTGGSTNGGATSSGRGSKSGTLIASISLVISRGVAGLSINPGRVAEGISARLITTLAGPVEPPSVEVIGSVPS